MLVERTKRCASCAATKLARDFYSDAASDDRLSACGKNAEQNKTWRDISPVETYPPKVL